jgi:hypothetical protein
MLAPYALLLIYLLLKLETKKCIKPPFLELHYVRIIFIRVGVGT